MSLRALNSWSLLAVTVWAAPSLASLDRASAASYFCSPAPIKLGSYRPDDTDEELDITVRFPDQTPFWLDDQSGDYQGFAGGVVGPLERAKVTVPLDAERERRALGWPGKATELSGAERERASLGLIVAGMFQFGQCLPSPMGVVPPEPKP